MNDDLMWLMFAVGVLSVAVLLQAAELARLRDDVTFVRLAASAAFTERELEP